MSIPDWTNVTNTFELSTTITHSTISGVAGYVQGGAYSSSSISQEVELAPGYEYGVAHLTCQRATAITGDTGAVTLRALDGPGGSVLASVTTGVETTTPDNVWHRRQLALQLPDGTTHVEVVLVANRAAGSGLSGACFDDFHLRVHKDLAPVHEVSFDFTARPAQPTPRNWQRWHLAWPNATALPEAMLAHGSLGMSAPRPIVGEGIAWSDLVGNPAAVFLGNFGIARSDADHTTHGTYRDAYSFVYQGPHLQMTGVGSKRRGAFTSLDSFAVRVVLKARQYGSGAGICGCRDTASGIGWGLSLTSSGQVRATLQGVTGTKTATSAASIADGAPHQVVMVYSAASATLRIYVDRRGYVETSTASGMGEFALSGPAGSYPVRVGTDRSSTDVFGGELLEIDLIPSGTETFTQAEIESMWPYAAFDDLEPGLSHAVWVPQEPTTQLAADVTLVRCAREQAPVGYHGGAHGLAITGPSTNLWPSNDPLSTSAFQAESTVTLTRAVQDPTGIKRGIRVSGDATHGLLITPTNFGVGATKANVTVFARSIGGPPPGPVTLALLNASNVVVDSESLALTTQWKRFDVTMDWAGSASGYLRMRSAVAFEVSAIGFACAFSVALAPSVVQDAGVSLSSVYASWDGTQPLQLNSEGEIDVEGVAPLATPALNSRVAGVTHAADSFSRAFLQCNASGVPRFAHHNESGTAVNSDGSAFDWSQPWRLRGRWARAGIPCATPDAFAGIVVDASVDTDDQDARSVTFDASSVALEVTEIGGSTADSLDAYIRRFTVRTRERKLE